MCDNYRNTDTADWRQYHPSLQQTWNQQITAYAPIDQKVHQGQIYQQNPVKEEFIDWDDPYKNIRFWTIIDFLRGFKLTK